MEGCGIRYIKNGLVFYCGRNVTGSIDLCDKCQEDYDAFPKEVEK